MSHPQAAASINPRRLPGLHRYNSRILCEPQLGKRGLYPTLNTKESQGIVRDMMNLIPYCDGTNDLLSIAEMINMPIWALFDLIKQLLDHQFIEQVSLNK